MLNTLQSRKQDQTQTHIQKYFNEQKQQNITNKLASIKKRVFGRDLKNENHNILNLPWLNPPKNNKKYKLQTSFNKQDQNHKLLSFQFDQLKQSNSSIFSSNTFEQKFENDPQYVTEYSVEIFQYLKENEEINKPKSFNNYSFQKNRTNIYWWLYEICISFSLLHESFYLSINLFDRYSISNSIMSIKELKLCGLASLFIAAKYEEIYPPELDDFILISGKIFKREEILSMEYNILKCMNFELEVIYPMLFLKKFTLITGNPIEGKVYNFACFLLDACESHLEFCQLKSSLKAILVLLFAFKMLKIENVKWNSLLKLYSGYEIHCLIKYKELFKKILQTKETIQYKSLIKKYSSDKYSNIGDYILRLKKE